LTESAFVTGPAGFIGSQPANQLLRDGCGTLGKQVEPDSIDAAAQEPTSRGLAR